MTNEEIEQKQQQLKQLAEEVKQLKDELVEAGAWPLDESDLDSVSGGRSFEPGCCDAVDPHKPVTRPQNDTKYLSSREAVAEAQRDVERARVEKNLSVSLDARLYPIISDRKTMVLMTTGHERQHDRPSAENKCYAVYKVNLILLDFSLFVADFCLFMSNLRNRTQQKKYGTAKIEYLCLILHPRK